MRLAEAVTRLYLHDSIVQDVRYLPHESKLAVVIELCNWAQPEYVDGEPEVVVRLLAFSGVTSYRVRPSGGTVRGGQILVARVCLAEEGPGEVLTLVLAGRPEEGVTIISITAEDATLE